MESRAQKESLIRTFTNTAIIVDINPNVNTHLGKVTMLDRDATLIEEVGKDWCIIGQLQDLTDDEFNLLFTAVHSYADKLLSSVASY